ISRKLAEMKVEEIMNRRPRTVRPDTTIKGLLERMLGEIDACFPVVDKNMNLLGIVTESDVLHVLCPLSSDRIVGSAGIRQLMKTGGKKVEDIMTENPITVKPETKVKDVLEFMRAHKLRRIPVVKEKKLVGIIRLRDIIQAYKLLR
ncbi:MAG: CBS domain-containing protein, partial [Candidatus Hadarchaeales archaeon]